ncbi:MAG: LacI family DNA-binding transcriptional regulator, partial [Chloroflexota bacterium]
MDDVIVPVTIKDIARAAGVSHSTVSRALKDNPAISPETTMRIQDLAREMGYVPNTVAQNLLSQETKTIGVVVTTIADPFITEVVEGVEQVAQAAGYSIFLSMSHNNPSQEMAVVETFQRRRVDAIVVTSSRVGHLYSQQLHDIQVPVVIVNNEEEGQYVHSVSADDVTGAQLAVDYLLCLGHRKIAYLDLDSRRTFKSNRRRFTGYQMALEEAGLTPEPALTISAEQKDDMVLANEALQHLLNTQATAVFCYNDMTAIGLMAACWRNGIQVPNQLSIIGFDDLDSAKYATPPLTTIHQPRQQLGRLAMEMTLSLMAKKET